MKQRIFTLTLITIFLLFHALPVYAHKMMIEPVEDGKIKVTYADGSFSSRTVVTVYDENGTEVAQGPLDEEGYFSYDISTAHSFVAEDGLGHRSEWTIGEEGQAKSDPHQWITVGIVVLIFVIVAIIFSKRAKKKKLAA